MYSIRKYIIFMLATYQFSNGLLAQQSSIAPQLVIPANSAVIHNLNPILTWLGSGSSSFRLKITQLIEGQTPYMALMTNPMLVDVSTIINAYNYPVSAPLLQEGFTYAWQVCISQGEYGEACSEVWTFTVKRDSIIEEDKTKLNVFPRLRTTKSSTTYKSRNNMLPFYLDGQYSVSELNYKILDSKGKEINKKFWESQLVGYGENRFLLKIKGLSSGAYTLVVTDNKSSKYYLSFLK